MRRTLFNPLEPRSRVAYVPRVPLAVFVRRAGFPTARIALAGLLILLLHAGPARAALSPPPVRLALLFERELWGRSEVTLPIPVRAGVGPIPFEVP